MLASAIDLITQISTGSDGVVYLGVDRRGANGDASAPAEVHVARLFLARQVPHRWHHICHRVNLTGYIKHGALLRAVGWEPEGGDPCLVTPKFSKTLSDWVSELGRDESVKVVIELAELLSEAHSLGFAHGRLCPSRVAATGNTATAVRPLLDLYDLEVGDLSASELDIVCLRDPQPTAHAQERDVYSLGQLCMGLLTHRELEASGYASSDDGVTQVADAGSRLSSLLREMISPDPRHRPTMHEVASRLQRGEVSQLFTIMSPGVEPLDDSASGAPPASRGEDSGKKHGPGDRLGRYDLKDVLGQGGMGTVFRAIDISSERVVALKVLHTRWSRDDEALHRFYREARLLSQLHNEHIASFIDANEVDGTHYLAMEFVEGESLHETLKAETRLTPRLAITVVRDVSLALADVHDLGIVHRDIKPANILLVGQGETRRAKLCDFGIAREVSTDSELTKAGLTVGTPHYMSPEQCVGDDVTSASDIYALGITLFKMLAGYVPFNAKEAQAIVFKHLAEPVPDIGAIAPEVDEGTARLLRRMLEKTPKDRIQEARALLEELEPLRSGKKTSVSAHPRLPEGAQDIITYDFEWSLSCSPAELWPHVSHTERLNRAIGLGAVDFKRNVDDGGRVQTRASLKQSGLALEWHEHPYEWVAPTRMGVLREYSAGPFHWLRSTVQLLPSGSGTALRHQIQVQSRGLLGKAAAAMEIGFKARKNLEIVYRRINDLVAAQRVAASSRRNGGGTTSDFDDPFEQTPQLPTAVAHRINSIEAELGAHVAQAIAERLCDHVRHAPPQEIARIRPRVFARQHRLDHRAVLRGCLHGAKLGLLVMLWDVICPRCRIPSNIVESLEGLREHDHCDACNLDFELDFGSSVEIIFRADPSIRASDIGTYCIGGPGHTPHVIMQIRLDPGERFEVDLMLEEGDYNVTGRQLATNRGFTVRRGAALREWEVSLTESKTASSNAPASGGSTAVTELVASSRTTRVIDAGRQRVVLTNDTSREVVARIEREGTRGDAITAAEAAATTAFRELFPGEVLAPGHLISIGRVTFLIADANVWADGDEAAAFARLTDLSRVVAEVVAREGGAVVKVHGDGLMAAFSSPADATRAALSLIEKNVEDMRVVVHTGPAMATSINDRLDYFGRVVRHAEQLLAAVEPGAAAVSETAYAYADVSDILANLPGPMGLLATQEVVGQVISSARPTLADNLDSTITATDVVTPPP